MYRYVSFSNALRCIWACGSTLLDRMRSLFLVFLQKGEMMSRRGKFVHEAAVVTHNNFKGSLGHHARLRHIIDLLSVFLWKIGITPTRVRQIPLAIIELYGHYCLSMGINPSTVINRVSAIRMILERSGRDVRGTLPAELGIPRRDRTGKKTTWSEAELQDLFARAKKLDEGFAHLLRVQVRLGLRAIEALRCAAHDLEKWAVECTKQNYVTAGKSTGTKGGRSRNISILEEWRAETILAIQEANEFARKNSGRLIIGTKNNSEGGLHRLNGLYRRAGLSGARSSHSLRYSYAAKNAESRKSRGEEELYALGEICEDLGHGKKTRKRFVLSTYLNSVSHLFENVIKNGKLISAPASAQSAEATDCQNPWYVPRDGVNAKEDRDAPNRRNHHDRNRGFHE